MSLLSLFLLTACETLPADSEASPPPENIGERGVWREVKYFGPQALQAIWEMGPIDAFTSGVIGIGVAEQKSHSLYDAAGERHVNAFRHCYGSCLAYQNIGEDALIAMRIHEDAGMTNEGFCERAIDEYHNDLGINAVRFFSEVDCESFCVNAMESGALILDGHQSNAPQTIAAACRN